MTHQDTDIRRRSPALRTLALLWLALLAAAPYAGASASGVGVGPVYTNDLPRLDVVVEVRGESGEIPLGAEELTLVEDGQATVRATAVRPFRETGRGMAVVVVLDVSGTMGGKPLADVKRALRAFVAAAGPEDRVAVVSFADDERVEADFGATPDELRPVIEGLAARGRTTELYRAIFKALTLFDAKGLPERRRMVLISDGKDEGNAYTLDDVIARAQAVGVPVHSAGITRVDARYLSNLERLSDLSGGMYAKADDSAELEGILNRWLVRLQASPVATFTPANLGADGQEHRVGVRVRSGERMVEGETKVVFPEPAAAAPSVPSPMRKMPRWVWLAGLALLGLVVVGALLLVAISRRRRTAFRPLPAAAHAFVPPAPRPAGEPRRDAPQRLDQVAHALPSEAPAQPVGAPLPVGPAPSVSPRRTQIRTEFPAPVPGSPAAVLSLREGPKAGGVSAIEVDPYWIGGEEGATLSIGRDEHMSGFHACIRYQDGSLLLYDNHSTNGTFVNGERLGDTPRPLTLGDRIQAGASLFVVEAARRP